MSNSIYTSRALYIHIPFCEVKCHYCDFATAENRQAGRDRYLIALQAELHLAAQDARSAPLTTCFLGGGTPSTYPPTAIAQILDTVAAAYGLVPGAEISMEANPTSVTITRLAGYRAAGVNRISLGVQSFHDQELRRLGRSHTACEAIAAVSALHRAGFSNWNLDLIYGIPAQTPASWSATLDRALALGPPHLSLYPLQVENHTRFALLDRRGQLPRPGDDETAEMYEAAVERLRRAGLDDVAIADVIHAAAFFNWANRLMLSLGEPVLPAEA